jgi:hypothetical protein
VKKVKMGIPSFLPILHHVKKRRKRQKRNGKNGELGAMGSRVAKGNWAINAHFIVPTHDKMIRYVFWYGAQNNHINFRTKILFCQAGCWKVAPR